MIENFEDEVVEFKEAKTNYSFKDIGGNFSAYQQLIINALRTMKSAKVSDIKVVLEGALPAIMDEKQKTRKVSNILQNMKKEGIVWVEGSGHKARWMLADGQSS